MTSPSLTRIADQQVANQLVSSSMTPPEGRLKEHADMFEESSVKLALTKEASEAVELCFDEDFGQQFRSRLPIEGTTDRDYQNRAYVDAKGKLWVAGIRFRNLDRNQAFIGLAAPVFSGVPDAEDTESLLGLLRDYAPFAVKRIQVLCLSSWPNESEHHAGLTWTTDKWIVAGRVDEVAMTTVNSALELRPPTDDSYLERYNQVYDELNETRPQVASLLAREDKESFADCLAAELLFEVFYEGEWAGLIAAEPSELFGMKGYLVREEVLSKKMRGKGLGVQMQAALAKMLAARGEALLHGTIHAGNHPSLLTALRAGRKIVGCYGFWNQTA